MPSIVCKESNGSPVWSTANFAVWKGVPGVLGGGKAYIQQFKTAWVRHNRDTIKLNAMNQRFPPELLAGVCWIEVGGDPNFVERPEVRELPSIRTRPRLVP